LTKDVKSVRVVFLIRLMPMPAELLQIDWHQVTVCINL